ncbi:MAG TPA: TIGR01777 family oxidoreductase [Ginsengibacter sp.]|nr:TIGR01777 family oxidoreductase [Ginsengibacter sp.]
MAVVLISGGTGLIGKKLTSHLIERKYQVIILSRNKKNSSVNPQVSYSFWDVKNRLIDADVVRKADYIIHLAGAGVMDKNWTKEYKQQIIDSRTKSSDLIIKALKENNHQVKSFVSASAIGWYGADAHPLVHKDGFIETDPADKSFLGETCVLWESSVDAVAQLGIRLVKLRTGIVLDNAGGAFKEFKAPLNFGVAAILGDGKQIVSWIHLDDICRMYIEAMENKEMSGVYNAVAPLPVSNKKLILATAEKLRNKFFIPIHVPIFFLKLFMGKRSIEILKSATVCNKKIKSTGFTFLYPTMESALDNLINSQK